MKVFCTRPLLLIRNLSAKQLLSNESNKLKKEKKESLIYQRLKQLAEDLTPVDDSIKISQDALPFNQSSPQVQKLVEKLESGAYEAKYTKEISYTKIPNYVNKHSKDIALSNAWTGTESTHDLNLRMLVDAHKPMTEVRRRPRVSQRDRLHNAREGSLDYTLAKFSGKPQTNEEDDGWTERYRERLLGPELLGPTTISSTMNSIKALADRRIEDAKSRGEFDNLPNRGKPLLKDHNAQSPYIDRTEYHLNSILRRQEIVPPWIERQGSVQILVNNFRNELDKMWLKRAVTVINDRYPGSSIDQKLQKAKEYARNEIEGGTKLRDAEWIIEQNRYLEAKINSLNDTIRGYNLQAPLASQKLYLLKDKELELMYKRVNGELLYSGLKKFHLGEEKPEMKQVKPGTYLKYDQLPQRSDQESLGSLFLNIFKKS